MLIVQMGKKCLHRDEPMVQGDVIGPPRLYVRIVLIKDFERVKKEIRGDGRDNGRDERSGEKQTSFDKMTDIPRHIVT
jgi:hypothetical protein